MLVYPIAIILIFALPLIRVNDNLLYVKDTAVINKRIYVVLVIMLLILLSGLRHETIGADTITYKSSFASIEYDSWFDIFKNIYEVYFNGSSAKKDPGYAIFEKICYTFSDNYQIYLIIIAVLFHVCFGVSVYRNSRVPTVSFAIYLCLFYAFFGITGHRQTIATAVVVFIGYELVKQRKLMLFLICVVIGFTIHKSSLIFLPFYWIYNKKITFSYLAIFICIMPIFFIFNAEFSQFFKDISGYGEFYTGQYEGAGTETFTLMLILIFIVALIQKNIILQNNPQVTHCYNAIMLAIFFTPLTYVNPSAMRVVQYYSVFIMFLIPEIILSFKDNDDKIIAYIVSMGILIFLFMRNNYQYLFFWQ